MKKEKMIVDCALLAKRVSNRKEGEVDLKLGKASSTDGRGTEE